MLEFIRHFILSDLNLFVVCLFVCSLTKKKTDLWAEHDEGLNLSDLVSSQNVFTHGTGKFLNLSELVSSQNVLTHGTGNVLN